jgi:hypothetical protein
MRAGLLKDNLILGIALLILASIMVVALSIIIIISVRNDAVANALSDINWDIYNVCRGGCERGLEIYSKFDIKKEYDSMIYKFWIPVNKLEKELRIKIGLEEE